MSHAATRITHRSTSSKRRPLAPVRQTNRIMATFQTSDVAMLKVQLSGRDFQRSALQGAHVLLKTISYGQSPHSVGRKIREA